MSTDLKHEIISTSSEQTVNLGQAIGARLRGGEVITLVSDLGGGKTTITKGIVKGAGSIEIVSSPTFTISKEYQCPKFVIKHYDFYRLSDAGIIAMELSEGFDIANVVTLIEWANVVEAVLPTDSITIDLKNISDEKRMITITVPRAKEYIVEGIR